MSIRKTIQGTVIVMISACLAVMVLAVCFATDETYADETDVIWGRYQNSLENNGVTDRLMPLNERTAFIRWGVKFSESMQGEDSFTPPIIIGDILYVASRNKVYALNKKTAGKIRVSDPMAGAVDYAMNPLEYDADHGYLYVPITKGRVVCLEADTLSIKWTSKAYDNSQAVSPIVYRDGFVYTGTYTGSASDGAYYCLDYRTGATVWEMKPSENGSLPSGFYWAGAYVSPSTGNYLIIGSEDGFSSALAGTGDYPETAVLYSLNKNNGNLIDKIDNCKGAIRSSVTFYNGYVYWVTKGGVLYKVRMNANGTFDHDTLASTTMPENGMMTSTPVIYNGRIYVGVAAPAAPGSTQFDSDIGHQYAVIDDDKLTGENADALIYTTEIAGYPQAASVLSTATEQTDDKVRLYFTYNTLPGGLYYLEDSSSSTTENHSEAEELFVPETDMKEHCISPLAVDTDGTIYFKNDSGYLMAVERNEAYLNSINIYSGDTALLNKNNFYESQRDYKLKAPDDANVISVSLDIPSGMTAFINNEHYSGSGKVDINIGDNSLSIPVEVRKASYTRRYNITVIKSQNNANLAGIEIMDTNTPVALSSPFNPDQTSIITREIAAPDISSLEEGDGFNSFISLNVTKEDPEAKIEVKPYQYVGTTCDDEGNITYKNGAYPLYWTKGQSSMTVIVRVTPASGKLQYVKDYYITFIRSEAAVEAGLNDIPDPFGNIVPARQQDKDPLLLSEYHVDLYTKGTGQTHEMKAFYGQVDVTTEKDNKGNYKCTWESTDETIVTVSQDENGAIHLHSTGKEGEAVVWAEYKFASGSKQCLRAHVDVSVTKPTAERPVANIESGRYTDIQMLTLESLSEGAEIRYNMRVDEDVMAPESTTGTVYNGPIELTGEEGRKVTYYIKAIATNEGFFNSSIASYRYVIDRRTPISRVELQDIVKPEAGKSFDDGVSVSDDSGVTVSDLTWYEVGEDEDTEVSGTAEVGKLYRAKAELQVSDPEHSYFADNVKVTSDARVADTERAEDELESVTASLYYSLDPDRLILIPVGGFTGGQKYSGEIAVAADGISVGSIRVKDQDGNDVTEEALGYHQEYTFEVTMNKAEDAEFDENATVALMYKGEAVACDVTGSSGTDFTVAFKIRTTKLKIDTSGGSGFIAVPQVISGIPNGSSETYIRSKFDDVAVKVKTVDGNVTEIDRGIVYWDTDKLDYDINSVAAAEFKVSGTINAEQLPDYLDTNGSSLNVMVLVEVDQGTVAAPKASPAAGTYTAAKKVTFKSATPGASIRYTLNGGKEKTFSEAISLIGAVGKSYEYVFTVYATKNGVKSKTAKFKYLINLPDPNAAKIAAAKKLKVSGLKVTCKSRKFTVKWKKNSKATGYQVQYKLKSKKKWSVLKMTKSLKVVSKKLKKGKKYQFKVRTYKTIAGKKYYGKWTTVKTVKCK